MTQVRQLTDVGIQHAREFLASVRTDPDADPQPPDELLFDGVHTARLPGGPDVRWREFATRRDAAEYLQPLLAPIQHQIADHAGFWSWLGMYYFNQTAPRIQAGALNLSPLDETFVVHHGDQQSYQRRYRHYLWSAWRLQQQHGESAAFLLDQPLTSFGEIADRVFSYSRIFNSHGVVQLILSLYTDAGRQKRDFARSRGGLRHLIRVLDQLERTYDVYGMTAEALLDILPPEFDAWKPSPSLT